MSGPARVYPRVCGGTGGRPLGSTVVRGLSPRVRGNLRWPPGTKAASRSIPACAGEPGARSLLGRLHRVYPRVCGGTRPYEYRWRNYIGLSPRVRGNRRRDGGGQNAAGSIPACAGEPAAWPAQWRHHPVYPRVCGGTYRWLVVRMTMPGLSPRVRGNQPPSTAVKQTIGSIPACAGEPRAAAQINPQCRVYPRVCGGTTETPGNPGSVLGLSPRVRGNLITAAKIADDAGSIPACAGEPSMAAG